jgi:YD repeat-containing protein
MRFIGMTVVAGLLVSSASAQSSNTYTYDGFGRLTKVTPSTGTPVCYNYDAADNRTTVTAAVGCTSQGGGQNSPPQAVNDVYFRTMPGSTWSGYLYVLTNDTDPNLPSDTLTVVSVSGSPYATVYSNGQQLYFSGPEGDYVLTYTIRDAAFATSSATVHLYVSSLQ